MKNHKILEFFAIIVIISIASTFNVTSVADSDESNNHLSVNVTVVDTQKLKVIFRPVDFSDTSTFDSNVELFLDFFNKTYPLADIELIIVKGNSYTTTEDERNDVGKLLSRLAKRDLIIGQRTRTVGVVPQYWFKNYTNRDPNTIGISVKSLTEFFAAIPSGIAEARNNRFIASHEIAHTFSICDEHTASEWENQDNFLFPCPNGDLDNNNDLDGNCTEQGCPVNMLGKLASWNGSSEFVTMDNFMGAELPNPNQKWITVESYNRLLSGFTTSSLSSITGSIAILVDGVINRSDDTVKINKPYIIENAELTQQDLNDSGNYSIEVIDDGGFVSYKINFTPSFFEIGLGGNSTETNISYFVVILNFSSSDKGIVTKHKGVVKDGLNKTPNAPTLNLTKNLTGILINNNFTIEYNSTDADGDTVEYAILISSDDGSNYTTLDIDYPNSSFNVNTSGFTESQNYKLKVLATDGINTNTTVSEGTFEIDNDLRITNLSVVHKSSAKTIFSYITNNTLEDGLSNIKEGFDTGDSTINFTINHSLMPSEEMMVFVEYSYASTGDKIVTASATSGNYVETESSGVRISNIEVANLTLKNTNLTRTIFEFIILNNIDLTLTNVDWTFDTKNNNIINNTITSALQPIGQIFVYIGYNFTSSGTYNVNATARNGSLSDSKNLTMII